MRQTFWVGCYPGLREEHMRYVAKSIQKYFSKNRDLRSR